MSSDPPGGGRSLFDLGHTLRFRLAKGLLKAVGLKAKLTVDSLWPMACRLAKAKGTALPGDIERPLSFLVDSLEDDARLHTIGRQSARYVLLLQLATRIQVDLTLRANPEIGAMDLPAPLVIVGLPRTGTTLLHRLMAQDATTRSLQMWEMFVPVLDPVRWRRFTRMRRAMAKQTIGGMRWWMGADEERHLDQVHATAHDRPEECIFLLARTFMCEQFYWLLGDVRGYLDWLRGQDFSSAYAHYADQLRLLCAQTSGQRLVLKAPEHLARLDALTGALTDARVVWLHRRPAEVVASFCSLVGMYHRMASDHFSPSALGRDILTRAVDWIERGRAFCQDRAGDRVLHVAYADLVADPFAVAERVYAHWGQVLPEHTLTGMRRWAAANPKDKHGRHRYALEEFGLSEGQVDEAFGAYGCWTEDILSV